jgi:GH25 family lysozyme M1 (1,4-beta-N-acetylmuramidase)
MLKGIDVWSGTGPIDWRRVKASGVDFAYVRAAYGVIEDGAALSNLEGAKAAGLVCGVYHFLRTTRSYQAQIDLMLQQIDALGVGPGDIPPAVDVEDNPRFDGNWSPAKSDGFLTALDRWIDAVRDKTGACPVIYTRAGFWAELGNPAGFAECPLWVASYRSAPPRLPQGWDRHTFWQYSEAGTVPGIAGPVDLNYFRGERQDLEAMLLK